MVTLDQTEMAESKDFLMYDTFRLGTFSEYKMTTAQSNEYTKQIQFLAKEDKLMKNVNRNVRHLTNQGLKERVSQGTTLTQVAQNETKEAKSVVNT